jgi:hypothetical protein
MSNAHRRARDRGKAFERSVARLLGGSRPRGGNRGVAASDIDGVPWSVEVTRVRNVGARLHGKWEQTCRNARAEGREPVLIAAKEHQRTKDALVLCRLELFSRLAGTSADRPE